MQSTAGVAINTNVPGIPSSFPTLNGRCIYNSCRFSFGDVLNTHFVRVQVTESVGLDSAPTLVTAPISQIAWITPTDAGGRFQISCGHGGSLYYDPQGGATTLTVEGMTDLVSCPGTAPAARDMIGGFY